MSTTSVFGAATPSIFMKRAEIAGRGSGPARRAPLQVESLLAHQRLKNAPTISAIQFYVTQPTFMAIARLFLENFDFPDFLAPCALPPGVEIPHFASCPRSPAQVARSRHCGVVLEMPYAPPRSQRATITLRIDGRRPFFGQRPRGPLFTLPRPRLLPSARSRAQ